MIRTKLALPAVLLALLVAHPVSADALSDLVRDGVIKPIDPASVTVSGTSSGAYMALQYAVSHPEQVIGFGMIAGGSYMCAGTGSIPMPVDTRAHSSALWLRFPALDASSVEAKPRPCNQPLPASFVLEDSYHASVHLSQVRAL